jgi:SAM-dependent methyltransferase
VTKQGSQPPQPPLGTPAEEVTDALVEFFTPRVAEHGATHKAVDWNSTATQEMVFARLMSACDPAEQYSVIDYGCGYGALARYLAARGDSFEYQGFDVTPAMVEAARTVLADLEHASVTSDPGSLRPANHVVGCGLLTMKFIEDSDGWESYVRRTLDHLAALSTRSFAFNMLTSYSDPPLMRPDLYYADPCFYFDYCKRRFARNVALLHDYGRYEFTIVVRYDDYPWGHA